MQRAARAARRPWRFDATTLRTGLPQPALTPSHPRLLIVLAARGRRLRAHGVGAVHPQIVLLLLADADGDGAIDRWVWASSEKASEENQFFFAAFRRRHTYCALNGLNVVVSPELQNPERT